MLIGVPKEIKNHEYRVGLTASGARELSARGHQVLVERDAGVGIGLANEAFEAAGACDLFLSIGTSGLVHPAAQLPAVARQQGATLLHVNPQKPQGVADDDYCLLGPAGAILPLLLQQARG